MKKAFLTKAKAALRMRKAAFAFGFILFHVAFIVSPCYNKSKRTVSADLCGLIPFTGYAALGGSRSGFFIM